MHVPARRGPWGLSLDRSRRCSRVRELFGERNTVHRIDRVEELHGPGDLIALQVADEMPRGVQVLQKRLLRFPLLDAVLAEMAQAGGMGGANRLRGKSLRDCHQRDFLRASAGASGSLRDSLPNGFNIRRYRSRLSGHCRDSNM